MHALAGLFILICDPNKKYKNPYINEAIMVKSTRYKVHGTKCNHYI